MLRSLLAVTDRLNVERNAALLEQMKEFAEALVGIGISPIALKGGALLLDEKVPDGSAVMLGDLDLLIQPQEVERAVGIATSLGYKAGPMVAGGHSVVLWHPERGASIDLHHDLGPQRHVLAAAEANGRAERAGAFPVRRLSPTDRAIHNIYHAQIQNRNYRLAILSLHQLCNLGLLIEGHGSRIDWDFVTHQFERGGYEFICWPIYTPPNGFLASKPRENLSSAETRRCICGGLCCRWTGPGCITLQPIRRS